MDLDLFSGSLTERQLELFFHVGDQCLVEFVTADANRLTRHDATERDDGDLRRTTTDVHDHVAGRFVNRQTGTDRGGHRLFDDVGLARAGELGRFHDGTLFDARDTRRHADHHARFREATLVDAVDEVAQHLLADLEVRDHAVLQGPDGLDVARGTTDHALGLGAYGERLSVLDVDGNHGGLVQDDAAAAHVDQRVRSSEVNRHITTQKRETTINHKDPLSSDDDALFSYKARTPDVLKATRPTHSRGVAFCSVPDHGKSLFARENASQRMPGPAKDQSLPSSRPEESRSLQPISSQGSELTHANASSLSSSRFDNEDECKCDESAGRNDVAEADQSPGRIFEDSTLGAHTDEDGALGGRLRRVAVKGPTALVGGVDGHPTRRA